MSHTHVAILSRAVTADGRRTAILRHWQHCDCCGGTGHMAIAAVRTRCPVCEGRRGWFQEAQATLPDDAVRVIMSQDGNGVRIVQHRCQTCGHRFSEHEHSHHIAWLQLTVCCHCCVTTHLVPCLALANGSTDPISPDDDELTLDEGFLAASGLDQVNMDDGLDNLPL
jgi:hypothetical protein